MTKLSNAVLALAAALLATGALAQVGFMQATEQVTVPAELFGGDAVELEFDMDKNFAPKAKLIKVDASTMIGGGTTFSVTYTLSGGATFAEEVSNSNFMWGSWGPATNDRTETAMPACMFPDGTARTAATMPALGEMDETRLSFCPEPLEMQVAREGGSKGASSVTFKLESQATEITPLASPTRPEAEVPANPLQVRNWENETRKIVFVLPDVNAMGKVDVTTSVAQTTSGGMASTVSSAFTCYVPSTAPAAAVGAMMRTSMGCPTSATVVATHAVIDGGVDGKKIDNTESHGKISLEDRRTLVGADDKTAKKITLSTIKVNTIFAPKMGPLKDQNGDDVTKFAGKLSGDLLVTVSSDNFNPGDVVSVGTKEFTIADGVASGSVDLSTAAVTVSYAPGGEDPLKHGAEFTTNAKTQFDNDDNANTSAGEAVSTLMLAGIDAANTARAYAIAPLTSTDISNVRVTCEAAQGCQIFLDCKDQTGVSTFYEDGAPLDGYTTVVWAQSAIAEALGLAEGWAGRMSCDVLSTAPVSVQVLTRAAGVLVNNTYVDRGGQ